MAKTIAYVQEHHYDTRENLQLTFDDISEKCKESRKAVKATEASLKNINQQIELYESAVKFLKEKNADGKIPSMKSLKAEKEKLIIKRSAQYDTYHYFKEYQQELRTVCYNVDSILGQPHTLESDRTPNHDIS